MKNLIWSEKWRPTDIKELVLPEKTKTIFKSFIKEGQIPNILLHGPPGSGKTTLAMVILKLLAGKKLILNASSEDRGIGTVKLKIKQFAGAQRQDEKLNIVLLDECFAKGTLIKTPNGDRPIETIKTNDNIINITGIDKVNNIAKNTVRLNRVVCLSFNNSSKIFCSIDHKFLTNKGWIQAKNLTQDSYFLTCNTEAQNERIPLKMPYMQRIFCCWCKQCKVLQTMQKYSNHLQTMWQDILQKCYIWKVILQPVMWFKMEKCSIRISRKNIQQTSAREANKKDKEMDENSTRNTTSKRNFFAYERPQLQSPFKRNNNKNENNNEEKNKRWVFFTLWRKTWREWTIYQITNTFELCFKLANGNCYQNSIAPTYWPENRMVSKKWISNKLQSRHRKQENKIGNRNRREETQKEKVYIERFEKNKKATSIRMDSIEIYKQGSNNKSFKSIIGNKEVRQGYVEFYDLKVNSHPSYIANGLIVHNSDGLTPDAQYALKNTIDKYHKNCRFIFTCNQIDKITDPIQSRCLSFQFDTFPKESLTLFLGEILKAEKIKHKVKNIIKIIESRYPDIRAIINSTQYHSIGGELEPSDTFASNNIKEIRKLIKKGKISELRTLWKSQTDFVWIYKYFFNTFLQEDVKEDEIRAEMAIVIAEYLHKDRTSVDKEINISACAIEIMNLLGVDLTF